MGLSELFRIEKIGLHEAREFISEWHYAPGCHNGMMAWGLHQDNNLVGVIGFACPSSENVRASIFGKEHKKRVTELHRLATKDDLPPNTESWFIARGLRHLKEYKPKYWAVVSFADPAEGHDGTVYQATNAIYYGRGSKQKFYIDEEGDLRHKRQNGRNIPTPEAEEMGWEPVRRPGKHRYLFLLPDGTKHREKLKNLLNVDSQPYPSGKETRGQIHKLVEADDQEEDDD